jgi:hypothetical protein
MGLIKLLQLATTRKDYAITVLHNLQITTAHVKRRQSLRVLTSRCFLAVFSSRQSLSELSSTSDTASHNY